MYLSSMITTTSNSKKLSFSEYNIYHIINGFGNDVLFSTDVWDRSSDVVFDTGIINNKYCVMIQLRILKDAIEFAIMGDFSINVFWLTE